MKFKISYIQIAMLVIIFLNISCQSIQSSFGKFNKNNNREAILTTIGYEENSIFKSNTFVSVKNLNKNGPLKIHVKKDSIKLSQQYQLKFKYENAQIDSLVRPKKSVIVISIYDKQGLIDQINKSVNLDAKADLKVVTEILVKDQPEFNDLIKSDAKYFQYNMRQKKYEILYYNNGVENSITLRTSNILGYKTMFLCCINDFNLIKVKSLSTNKCPKKSFKTLNDKSKSENYERF